MTAEHPHITLLKKYQEASNRHDIEACVAMFTEDGAIEFGGESYTGIAAIRAAHDYDEGSRTLIEFRDFEVDGELVRCTYWNAHELSRAVGNNGMTTKAEFTIKDNRIHKFYVLPADESERKRIMEKAVPAINWLRENYPEVLEKWKGFDKSAGEAVFALAELWRKHQQSGEWA